MIDQAQTDKFKEILRLSKNILVIFPETKDLDLFLASYCLYSFLSLKVETRLLSPKLQQKLPPELADLIESKKIETELGKENLLINFPYQENQVENVSYYIGEQNKRFYLTIKPKKGVAPLDSSQVEFAYVGSQADLLILCGVENLEDLAQLYFTYENLYKSNSNHLVTINNFIPDFGNLNLDISSTSSYCEALFYLLQDLEQNSQDILAQGNLPTLLLYGIEYQSRGLQAADLNANTFLTVAALLKLGAVRLFKLNAPKIKVSSTKHMMQKKPTIIEQSRIHLVKSR
ncbi:MAG TPA: hypothetical protein PLQ50_02160 [Candidatus Woesebacteria bacterium]|nr:hypothetical protein [Candidatus Woesebacteria bacterium]